MRGETTPAKVERLIDELGLRAKGPGRVYFTGGVTALLFGWRDSTVDVDLKLDPEPPGVFDAIAALKDELDLNVELASPDQFVPCVPGWRERSPFIRRSGPVDFHHFDLLCQALAKIERNHERDLADVRAMVSRKLVVAADLPAHFESIRAELKRYPAVDENAFEQKVQQFVQDVAP